MNHLLFDKRQGVLHITLNRPQVRNAMSLDMVRELREALQQAEGDASVRVVVLRGSEGHFCAGADIKDMAGARMRLAQGGFAPGQDPIAELNAAFGELCLAYARSPLPIVAVLEGSVMGGGFGLSCVSDVTLAAASTVFRLPETSLGVIPAQIAPFLIERLGYAEAKRLAVTGGRIDARQALAIRLVHQVLDSEAELQAALTQVVQDILACAPNALATTKALMAKARFEEPQHLIAHAAQLFSKAAQSAEGLEGMTAFIEKRKPNWMQ
jgi:isohexenylglutaconyl-CoA hydratase